MTLSATVLLPSYNEAENLESVIDEITDVLSAEQLEFEVLVVDDGSNDNTNQVVTALMKRVPQVRFIRLRRNFGKSKALSVGLATCETDLVILMDADGQDDPAEIPQLLKALDDGHHLVTGRRSIRNDRFIKRHTSRFYNWMTSRVSGVEGRDFNSGFKVLTREVAKELRLYGELHRYIPVLAEWMGFSSTEVDVNHRARLHGSTKFGRSRFWRGMLDLITVKFLTTYDRRPFHLMGGTGIMAAFFGSLLLVWMLILRISGEAVGNRPALIAGVLLMLAGLQLVTVGLLAELIVSRGHADADNLSAVSEHTSGSTSPGAHAGETAEVDATSSAASSPQN